MQSIVISHSADSCKSVCVQMLLLRQTVKNWANRSRAVKLVSHSFTKTRFVSFNQQSTGKNEEFSRGLLIH